MAEYTDVSKVPVIELLARLNALVNEHRWRIDDYVTLEAVRAERVLALKRALLDLEKGVTVNGMSHFNTDNIARLIEDVDMTGQRQFRLLTTGKP